MKTLIKNAKVVLPEEILQTSVLLEGAKIADIDVAGQVDAVDVLHDHVVTTDRAAPLSQAEGVGHEGVANAPPDYPIAYDAGKALHQAAKVHGETGFGAQWAGQGAPLARSMPVAELIATIAAEMGAA